MSKNSKFVIFSIAGKGGIGKTTSSVWLFQYLQSLNFNVQGFDTDPVNATFSSFKNLNVSHINIYNEKQEIDKSLIDPFVENDLFTLKDNSCAIVDNGTTSFNAMLTYLVENDIINILHEQNIDTYINVPVVGGSEHNETLKGLVKLHNSFDCQKIVFLNSFFGKMPLDDQNPNTTIPLLLKNALAGLVNIPNLNAETFGAAIELMQQRRMTFEEYHNDSSIGILVRTRVFRFKQQLFEEFDNTLPFKNLEIDKTEDN